MRQAAFFSDNNFQKLVPIIIITTIRKRTTNCSFQHEPLARRSQLHEIPQKHAERIGHKAASGNQLHEPSGRLRVFSRTEGALCHDFWLHSSRPFV